MISLYAKEYAIFYSTFEVFNAKSIETHQKKNSAQLNDLLFIKATKTAAPQLKKLP